MEVKVKNKKFMTEYINSAFSRMKLQGYTRKETDRFRKACRNIDIKMIENFTCKCNELPGDVKCEPHQFLEMQKIFNPDAKNKSKGKGRKRN